MSPNRRGTQHKKPFRLIAVAVAVAALVGASSVFLLLQSDSSQAGVGSVATDGGIPDAAEPGAFPLSESDKEFLATVRRANLWESPAGQLAETHASSNAVKHAGRVIVQGHTELDQMVREDAKTLGVEIPNEASKEQQEFVEQLEDAQGKEFDTLFADILRRTHSSVFPVIADVRVSTRNPTIRRFAVETNKTVLKHLRVIDDTGLVKDETVQEIAEETLGDKK
jgi:predicted outer membrane protein